MADHVVQGGDLCIYCHQKLVQHSFPSGMCMTPDGKTYYTTLKFSGWRTPEEDMGEKKYVVPEGGLKAAVDAAFKHARENRPSGADTGGVKVAVEAFIRWQSENPRVPTKDQQENLIKISSADGQTYIQWVVVRWIQDMYLVPEPEVPEEIKDLISNYSDEDQRANKKILEAYRRGREGE